MQIDKKTMIVGRLSDGSDRREITKYDVKVTVDNRTYLKTFDYEPEESEIEISEFIDITPKEVLLEERIIQLENVINDILLSPSETKGINAYLESKGMGNILQES